MSTLFVDTHVHLRKIFPREHYFDAAAASFRHAAAGLDDWVGVLMLTESATENGFRELADLAGPSGDPKRLETWGGWAVELGTDDASLIAHRDGVRIAVVAGRQIDTSERLEVSALGSDRFIRDGTPVDEVLAQAREHDTFQVLPWAPGKWSFARGRLLERLIGDWDNLRFGLGDNGGRPWIWPMPGPLRRAAELGIPVLPGSDPLPFPAELARTGSFGIRLEAELETAVATQLKAILRGGTAFEPYGKLNSAVAFFWKEFSMQLTKRKRKKIAAARAG